MIYRQVKSDYSSVSFRPKEDDPECGNVINTHIGDCQRCLTLFVSMCRGTQVERICMVSYTGETGIMTLSSSMICHCTEA